MFTLNPRHAEYFMYYSPLKVLSPIACSFPVVSSYFRKCGKECDPEQMAPQKQDDRDIQCL